MSNFPICFFLAEPRQQIRASLALSFKEGMICVTCPSRTWHKYILRSSAIAVLQQLCTQDWYHSVSGLIQTVEQRPRAVSATSKLTPTRLNLQLPW